MFLKDKWLLQFNFSQHESWVTWGHICSTILFLKPTERTQIIPIKFSGNQWFSAVWFFMFWEQSKNIKTLWGLANFADHLIPGGKLAQDLELVDFGLKQQGASNVLQLKCIVPDGFLTHRIWFLVSLESKESTCHFELSNECCSYPVTRGLQF